MDLHIEKDLLIKNLKKLSNELDLQYSNELNFRNHRYLRIAYDNAVNNKWDTVVQKPFVKYADINQLETAVNLLNQYKLAKNKLLLEDNKSLHFRNQCNLLKSPNIETLFSIKKNN